MELIYIAFKYLKKYPPLLSLILFFIMLASLFEGASFGMLIPLMQSMTAKTASLPAKFFLMGHLNLFLASMNQNQIISLIFIILFFLIGLKNMFMYLSSILIAKLRFGIVRNLSVNLMDNLIEYDVKYFDSAKTGYIISNVNAETVRIGDFMLSFLQFITLSGKIFAYTVILLLISWKASFIIFPLIASVLIPIELILKKVKKLGVSLSQAIVDYYYRLTEILSGIRLIKGCGTENLEKINFKTTADKIYYLSYKNNKYLNCIIPFSETFIFGLITLSFLVLINVIKIDIANTFPFIATYLLVLAKTLTQLNALNAARSEAINRLSAFRSYEEIYDKKGKKTIESGSKKLGGFLDSINFKNVSFSYINDKKILNKIDMKIPKGKITAIVGASGVGKSTIVNLILRFYDVTSGEILVDGINLNCFVLSEWRRKIGLVSQDTFIFNASVRDNILYGHSAISEEDIIKAAEAANAHYFIMGLPDQYDTILGERGVKLSGGEKQRVSIARAIIRDPEILILDEATSSLDTETERLIKDAIDRLAKNRTVIAIAHRLSTIVGADNIIVLDNGRVAENGNHAELFKKNGAYKRLYDLQYRV